MLCTLDILTTLMKTIFLEEMNDFVIFYINNILVKSKIADEHARHLEAVFGRPKDKKLYTNAKTMILFDKKLSLGQCDDKKMELG